MNICKLTKVNVIEIVDMKYDTSSNHSVNTVSNVIERLANTDLRGKSNGLDEVAKILTLVTKKIVMTNGAEQATLLIKEVRAGALHA